MSQTVLKRKCYIFECSLKKLEILLTLNAVNDVARKPVNLIALNFDSGKGCEYKVKAIVGEFANPDSVNTTAQQAQFEKNMKELLVGSGGNDL